MGTSSRKSENPGIKEDVSQGARMGLPQTDIGSGKTVSFMDSDGSMFYVAGGTTVSFSIELDRSASVEMGYISNTGGWTQTYSGTSSSHNTSFKISNTGYITGFTSAIHLPVPYG